MSKTSSTPIRTLTLLAMMAAIYVVLSTLLTLPVGNALQISWSSLPILISAALFGPWPAAAVALVGSLLEQLLLWGVSPTLPLWMAPVIWQAIVAGCLFRKVRENGCSLSAFAAAIAVSEVMLTAANVAVQYIDGAVMGYAVEAVTVLLPPRLLNCAVRAALSAIALPPIVNVLFPLVKE